MTTTANVTQLGLSVFAESSAPFARITQMGLAVWATSNSPQTVNRVTQMGLSVWVPSMPFVQGQFNWTTVFP